MTTSLFKRQSLRESGQARPSHRIAESRLDVAVQAAKPPVVSAAVAAVAAELRSAPASLLAQPVPQAEIDRIKEASRQEGLALGRRQAQDEAEDFGRKLSDRVDTALLALETAWHEERGRMQTLLADFAFAAANRLLADSLKDPRVAMASVRASLAACEAWQDLTVEVHPNDFALFEAALAEDDTLADKSIRVVPSANLKVAGCRIRSSEGSLDASLDFQLAELRSRLDALRAEAIAAK